jgi:threonine dehydrogenase-like Zn-dependent dehydrogenase
MRAITVMPGQPGSVGLTDMPEPPRDDGPVLVETQAIGICGTDVEIIDGAYGWAPPGQERLILGHESLGRVIEAPPQAGCRSANGPMPTAAGPMTSRPS